MAFRRTSNLLREVTKPAFDADGIPLKRSWSLRALMDAQPRISLDRAQLQHLYKLSALRAPAEGSQEEAKIKSELEEMIRLVEAVRTCPLLDKSETGQQTEGDLPDGRVWPAGKGMDIKLDWGHQASPRAGQDECEEQETGELLKLAQRTRDGYYVAPSPRSGSQDLG